MMFGPQYHSVLEAARMLKLSVQRVRVLLAKGRLQGYRTISSGGRVIWRVHLGLYRRPGKAGRPITKRPKRVLRSV